MPIRSAYLARQQTGDEEMNKSLLRAFLAPVAGVSLASCGVNSIPTAEEEAKARWADVQNDYHRRADVMPNLVATVRAAAAQ